MDDDQIEFTVRMSRKNFEAMTNPNRDRRLIRFELARNANAPVYRMTWPSVTDRIGTVADQELSRVDRGILIEEGSFREFPTKRKDQQ